MGQIFYNSLIQYIMMYYKSALVFSITICCLNVLAGKLYVFYETKNTPVLFFFAIYIYSVLVITILSRKGTYISEINLIPLGNFYNSEWERMCFYTNIILFFPMPVFLYSLYPALRNFYKCILLGFIISTGIEISLRLVRYRRHNLQHPGNDFGMALFPYGIPGKKTFFQ